MDINEYKHCSKCDNVYEKINGFYKNSGRYDGVMVYCRDCQDGLLDKTKYKIRREKLVRLLGGKCIDCGYDKDIRALQIDHINGGGGKQRKELNTYNQYKYIENNIGEFQVLCANCNFIKRDEKRECFNPERKLLVPITGEIREVIINNKRKVGTPLGSKRPNQAEKLKLWREQNPDAMLERNEKISISRTGKTYKRKKNA